METPLWDVLHGRSEYEYWCNLDSVMIDIQICITIDSHLSMIIIGAVWLSVQTTQQIKYYTEPSNKLTQLNLSITTT